MVSGEFAGVAIHYDWGWGWGWTAHDADGVQWFRVGPLMFGWFR